MQMQVVRRDNTGTFTVPWTIANVPLFLPTFSSDVNPYSAPIVIESNRL